MRTLILLIFCCLQSFAWANEELSFSLCQSIAQMRNQDISETRALFWRSLKLRYFPGLYAKPKTLKIENLSPVNLNISPSNLSNVVFFVGLPLSQQEEANSAKEQFDQLEKELKSSAKLFKKIAKKETIEACVQEVARLNLDLVRLKNISEELENGVMEKVKRLRETEAFEKELRQIENSLSRDWRIIKVSHLEEIRQWLASYRIGNAVIVTHGKTSGHLIDSYHNQYPNGFFENLSPTLYSLSLYNCYANATIQTYNLEGILASTPSIYTNRLLNIVKAPSEEERDQVAPIKGFSNFMRKLDRRLNSEKPVRASNANHSPAKTCHMNVSEAKMKIGTIALSLNRKFIGALKPNQTTQFFSFPCAWKNAAQNLLTLTNVSNESWDLNHAPKIQIDSLTPEIQEYHNSDQTLRSALYRF